MVVKKPYAFLIKNFRIIHGLLFALLFYLTIKTFDIYSFFSSYASTHAYINSSDLASTYVNYFMFFVIILVALTSLIIFYVLNLKKKSVKVYLFIFLYLIVLFVYFLYIFFIFQNLQTAALNIESVMVYRDISLIILLPLVILLFIILSRTLGFNLKQFDFRKDLEELEIDVTDNEEVEVTLGNDTYKIARTFRKSLRLLKYFVLENKIFVIGLSSIVILIGSLAILMSVNVYTVDYEESDQIFANSLWYKIENSYTTASDINNKVIVKNKKYVLVQATINNKGTISRTLNRETFRLEVDGEMLFPTFSLNDKFIDIGNIFSPVEIKSGEDKNYIVVFELDNSKLESSYVLKIKNFDSKTFGNIESEYKDILIKPVDMDKNSNAGIYKLSANLDFKDTLLKNSKMNITKYEISNKYKEKYTYCIKDNCKEAIYTIIPNNVGKGDISILKFSNTIEVDQYVYMSKYIKYPSDLLKYYGYIKYRYLGDNKVISISPMNVKYNNDKYSYIEVPSEISEANKIELIIQIRGIKYTITLK